MYGPDFKLSILKNQDSVVKGTGLAHSNFLKNSDEMAVKKCKLGNNSYTNQWISCLSMFNGRMGRALYMGQISARSVKKQEFLVERTILTH